MNRLLLFLCCIFASWTARGQAAYEWRYWFDMNHAAGNTGQAYGDRFTIETNSYGLSDGLHTIHMQITDTAGRFSPPLAKLFYHTTDHNVRKLYYWFDGEAIQAHSVSLPQLNLTVDVRGLEPGLHFIYSMVEDAAGNLSDVVCRAFYRQPLRSGLKWSYWFDDDESNITTIPLPNEMVMIDVSGLEEGLHVLHSQVMEHAPSDITTTMFIKVPQIEGTGDMTCICTVDGKIMAEQKLPAAGGLIRWDMDVSKMDVGIHKAMFQVITPSGAASTIAERYFVREITNKEMGNMKCVYAIDNAEAYSQAGTLSNGLFHFDLDVSSIENGLHRIAYMLVSEEGVTTPQKTAFFWKTPLGGEGIVQYDYWLNDRDDMKHSVQLSERTNPFNLITLLPIETHPIRTSNFKFVVKEGSPLIYARNEFHIQFFDTNGRMVEDTKEFVDEQVSQEVKPIGELLATQTFAKIAENDIRWYTMQAAPGDTVAFKLSQPATLQVFAPSGEEVFKTSESASVNWNGIHTWEKGTYYLAVHDVTGSQSTMKLEYMHMDKYYLHELSPQEFGVLPCVQILDIEGNGFDYLKSANLYLEDVSIQVDSIAYVSKSKARLYILLNGDEIYGKYDLTLNFDDGKDKKTITRGNCISLIQPSFENIKISIYTPRSTIAPYPITISVTNRSNISYQAIPFYFAIDHINQIKNIKYLNFGVTCSRELYENGIELSFGYDSFEGNGSPTRVVPTIIPELLPGETKTYSLAVSFNTRSNFHIYAWTGRPWNLLAQETKDFIKDRYAQIKSVSSRKKATGVAGIFDGCEDDPCDMAGPVNAPAECACGTSLALGGTLGGIQNALQNQHNRAMREQLSQSGLFNDPSEYFPDQHLPSPEDLIWYWLQHCLPGKAAQAAAAYNLQRRMNGDDPCQDPTPHTATPYTPVDPNDIYGYLSQAGSKFITDSVTKVNYTIEFENDTAFATAAAHSIVIKDTLDKKYFVLEEFMPTGVRIGDREVFLEETEVKTQNNVTSFVKTIDMRPEINAIAQVDGTFNSLTGIAQWTFQSLDPMTMESTYDLMQGILPVNFDGTSGIGEVMFEIGVKQGKADGAEIKNRASIVFDYEDAILTPTWTNIVDAVAPSSVIDNSWMVNDSTLRITAEAFDARSGVWKYEWYVQAGENAPWWKEGETDSLSFDYHIYEGIDYGFCVVATDSAGNVEQKVIHRERGFKTYGQDYEDTIIDVPADSNNDAPDAIYDLSGRKQAEPQENRVNIVGKKKILFRRNRQ